MMNLGFTKSKRTYKGPANSNSLANLINTTCTSQCVTDDLVAKCWVPENCDKICAPMINNEIWKILNKRAQSSKSSCYGYGTDY